MLNVTINKLSLWKLRRKGYCFEFNEKMVTLRTLDNQPVFELIYNEETDQVIILTKNEVYYASAVEIELDEKEVLNLRLDLGDAQVKVLKLNGKDTPIVYSNGKRVVITMANNEVAED